MAGRADFDAIHAELRPRITRYLRGLLGGADAEDATQEVFVRVSRALGDFRGDSSAATWVYRIATRVAFDRRRRVAAHRTGQTLLRIAPPPRDRAADAERALVRREMNDCIREHIAALPPAYRSALLLSDEGLGSGEIARALGISVATAKIRLHRARARLRKTLGAGCRLYRDDDNDLACEPRSGEVYLGTPGPRL